ncbi:hypothetical protein L917_11570 [Phytophthora nicotianae]|uniref:Uncharacterized protein n=1 Tax=Phytophthora nicotianae TaxID=4792 RepID=W2KWF9_PHYNI|nr:hypothetical protein L917_11570 [Phytophthora nicotianae]
MGLSPKDNPCHSLRIGGACALLPVGNSDLVIRQMGRWSTQSSAIQHRASARTREWRSTKMEPGCQ